MALRMRSPLPSLEGLATWVGGNAPTAERLADKPVLVHFWSISCYICHDVAKTVAGWRDRFAPQGLEVIAIHQPRGPEELDIARVTTDALGEMGLTQPCAIDNEHLLVDRFANQFVPAYYVFNRKHERHFQAGDKGYDRVVSAIERVLGEAEAAAA